MSEDRPLRLFIDEGGDKIRERDFAMKFQQARHLGIGISMNVQNASVVPAEVTTNCSMIVSFQCTDGRDRFAVEKAMRLTKEQAAYLGELGRGECVVYMPRSGWPRAILARVPEVVFDDYSDAELAVESKRFAAEFAWEPITSRDERQQQRHAGPFGDLDADEESLLRDVLKQVFEADPLYLRLERAGIRSAEKASRVIKKLIAAGYITVASISCGRGHPWKLLSATEKALEAADVKWKPTRGSVETRVATKLLLKKLRESQKQWQWLLEGDVEGKQVDILGRDEKGEAVAIEIAGKSGKHECHNALHLVRHDVRRIWVVCLSQAIQREVQRKFREHEELKGLTGRVVTLASVLREAWLP